MKKVTLTVVVKDEHAEGVAKQMERSPLAQEGIYTLDCGGIEDLTEEEKSEVISQVPEDYLD